LSLTLTINVLTTTKLVSKFALLMTNLYTNLETNFFGN